MKIFGLEHKLPISSAVAHAGLLYISGHVGFADDGTVVTGGIEAQTRRTLDLIDGVLAEAGVKRDDLISMQVYLKYVERDFASMNKVFAAWIGDHRPARTTVGTELANAELLVEIDGIAAYPGHDRTC
ncbi:MAG: RidA family protein [Planctomycetota bacterium]